MAIRSNRAQPPPILFSLIEPPMKHLERSDILDAETYESQRTDIRRAVKNIKDPRRVSNLANKPAQAERVARFSDKLASAFVDPDGVRFLAAATREED